MRASRHSHAQALLEALAQPGCPICRLGARAVARALESLAYEQVTDPAVQARFAAALGLCASHGRQLLNRTSSGQGVAILYRAVIAAALRRLEQVSAEPAGGLLSLVRGRRADGPAPGLAALSPDAPCPACQVEADAEQRAAQVLLEQLSHPDARSAYERSPGLCLPHLRLALTLARPRQRPAAALLLAHAASILRALDQELAEYVRKHDYRFQHEPYGAERDAPARALTRFVGERGGR
jgi:hypothetical protein